jgi:hypothetical protein
VWVDSDRTLVDAQGIYGGTTSRDQILRLLKEALALVDATPRDAELACAGLRIEIVRPGTPKPAKERRPAR